MDKVVPHVTVNVRRLLEVTAVSKHRLFEEHHRLNTIII